MKRLVIVACVVPFALTAIARAQPPAGPADSRRAAPAAPSIAAPGNDADLALPAPTAPRTAPSASSPGEMQMSAEARAHELHLLQSQAQEESVRRAAVARAEQRTRRLESQRWFGISNTRPNVNTDPFNGDYGPYWASNYPFYPQRWVGSGQPWGFAEAP